MGPALELPTPAGRPLRILCLGAHSDDIEIGCGGTLLALARRQSLDVRFTVLSGTPERASEARRSATRFLARAKAWTLETHEFRDGYFPAQWHEIKDVIQRVAAGYAPDLVFTHYRDDRHQDHRVISDLTWNAFRRNLILEYEIPKWDGDLGTPNVLVPLDAASAARKARLLLECFESQRRKDWFSADTFMGLMRLRGIECGARVAEAFYGRKVMITRCCDSGRKAQGSLMWARRFRPGELVEVRSEAEILATLDPRGMLDRLPFMPEMLKYCGMRFRVSRRAEKTCDTIAGSTSRRMIGAVHLENLRCSGEEHGGCQARCLLFWKDEWLKKVDESRIRCSSSGRASCR